MGKTFYLEGTADELQEILQTQFNLETEESRLYLSLLLMDQEQSLDKISDKEMALWFLNQEDKYSTPVFKSRFSISFTELKKSFFQQFIVPFAGIIIDGDSFAFTTVLNCLIALYRSCTHIKKDECCVYYQALLWKSLNPSQEYFTSRDILPSTLEGYCCYLEKIHDKKWECHSIQNEICDANEKKFELILDSMCKQHIFVKFGNMYRFEI